MNRLLVMVALLAIWPWSSAKEYPMRASSSVPAATGVVRAQQDKNNGNTKMEIKVYHLASPSSLTPSASAYIVWVRPRDGAAAVKQGSIKVDRDQKGEVKLITVLKDFEVFITAEQGENVSVPSDFEVLRADINQR